MGDSEIPKTKRGVQQNLAILCFGFFFVLSVYNGIEPLQSSLNSDDGLGTTTTGVIYATAVLSSLFVATSVINRIGPKRGILALFLSHTAYCVANFHPSWWTLVPASSLVGLTATVGWGSQGIYMVSLANSYAELTEQDVDTVMSLFTGIFFVFIGLTRPLGNLISSVILRKVVHEYGADVGYANESDHMNLGASSYHLNTSVNQTTDVRVCGVNHCPFVGKHREMLLQPDRTLIYVLMGVYLACNITGVAITSTLPNLEMPKPTKYSICGKFKEMLTLCKDYRLVLLVCPYLASGMVRAMHVGSFTQSFISCILGTGMVGYAMMCDGFGYAIMSFLSGRLTKYIPRLYHITTVAIANIAIATVWILWKPSYDTSWLLFILAFLQGGTNGVWKVHTMALTGVLFTDSLAAGYAHLMVWDCLGHAIVFGYTNIFCYFVKSYIFIGIVTCALISYFMLELVTRNKMKPRKDTITNEELETMNTASTV